MKLKLKLAAAAALAMVAFVPSAQAGSLFDDDGYQYRSLGHYCQYHHYTERCKRYRHRMYYRHHAKKSYYNSRCVSSRVHSVGKAWIPLAWARRSAIKAWQKEVRVEFGSQYANWSNAEGKSMSCGSSGTGVGKLCEAKGRPCR
jgi:hypothetical protein